MSNKSGWYKDGDGSDYHLLTEAGASDEDMTIIGKIVRAAKAHVASLPPRVPNACHYCGSTDTVETERISAIVGFRRCNACGKGFGQVDRHE